MEIVKHEDPIGKTLEALQAGNGLVLFNVSCPIGMIAAILGPRQDFLLDIFPAAQP